MPRRLTVKQKKFVQAVAMGANQTEAVRLAGYNVKSNKVAGTMASELMRKDLVIKALDDVGLTDGALAKSLKIATQSGLGVKSTNSDALRGIELAHRLKGNLNNDRPDSLNQTNVYINELRGMDETELVKRVNELTATVKKIST